MDTDQPPQSEFPMNQWPVVRWTPLVAQNEQNYGEWPEQQSGAVSDSGTLAEPLKGFQAVPTTGLKFRVVDSNLDGRSPDGFSPGDSPIYEVTVAVSGYLYAFIVIDTDGLVTSRTLATGATVPDDTATNRYYEIVGYNVTAGVLTIGTQTVFGPIGFEICPDWFTDGPEFNHTFTPTA